MSVIVSKRQPQKYDSLTKAIILARYTVAICMNEKNFPKKFRWILTKDIVNESLHIITNLRKAANIELQTKDLKEEKYSYQIEAYNSCESLLTLIEVAWPLMPLHEDRVEYWTGLVIDVEEAIEAWIKRNK